MLRSADIRPTGKRWRSTRKMESRRSHIIKVLERFSNYTYMEFKLETGRTHQIRVHMASIGHPLLGDTVYSSGKSPFKTQGQTLHAMTIGFIHPRTNEYMEISAPLPEYFLKILKVCIKFRKIVLIFEKM